MKKAPRKCGKDGIVLKLTPHEAEQTLRALNYAGIVGVAPYFQQHTLMSAAVKLTNAMMKKEESAR